MASCKSVILILDTEEGDEQVDANDSLVARMFREFFDLTRYMGTSVLLKLLSSV